MPKDPRFEALFNRLEPDSGRPAGLLQKVGGIIATLLVFGLALSFSVVLLAALVTIGLVVWGWLWWRTRELRKRMREQAAAGGPFRQPGNSGSAVVIEGEVIREVRDDERRSPGP